MAESETKKNTKQNHKFRLTIIMLASAPLAIGALLITIISSMEQYNSLKEATNTQLVSIAEAMASELSSAGTEDSITMEDGQMLVDGEDSTYISDVFDDIKAQTGVIMTIFYGDDSIYTSLMDDKGNRLLDAPLDAGVWSTIQSGQNHSAYNLNIDGTSYAVAYVPLKSKSNGIIGSVFAGVSDASIKKAATRTFIINIIIMLVIILVIDIIAFFIANSITRFIDRIKEASNSLSEGRLAQEILPEGGQAVAKKVASRNDELGELMTNTTAVTEKLRGTVIAIKATSPGPLIFKQIRVGLHNKEFQMYKFRSMEVQTEENEKKGWTVRNDPRVTKVGKFIRKTSIDEMPQLINVLKGDMSLIGPRPERPQYVEKFREEIPRYMIKHQVRPGMTGWAQVNGYRGNTSIQKRIEYDIYYIENWTLGFDFKILFLTIFKGFINKNAY